MSDDPRPASPDAPLSGERRRIRLAHAEEKDAYCGQLLDWMKRHPPAPGPARRREPAACLVLDTNVSLDLIVFGDPYWDDLRERIASGEFDVVTRADCREEFALVLGYPQFGLAPRQRVCAMEAFDAMHRMSGIVGCVDAAATRLPQCRDPDDQKFLELALETDADVLLSRDKALLKLARRNRRMGLFEILSPTAWQERRQPPVPEA